jgi:hypothetical protein
MGAGDVSMVGPEVLAALGGADAEQDAPPDAPAADR